MCSFIIENLKCPVCFNKVLFKKRSGAYCEQCSSMFSVSNDILDFLAGKPNDTLLDIETYDEHHNVNEQNAKGIYDLYFKNISEFMDTPCNELLEIGSGTGNLSYGLCKYSSFKRIHFSDVSFRFLNRLQKRIKKVNQNNRVLYYRFDANRIPFNDETVDVILGHSILHHLANFEKTLEDSYHVLKPGGVAMYGEPIMKAHAFISLAAALIIEADKIMPLSIIPEKEKHVLERTASKVAIKRSNLEKERDRLESIEDKFIFPIEYMRNLSEEIGFQYFKVIQWAPVTELGPLIKSHLVKLFKQNNCEPEVLNTFDFIFKSISDTFGVAEKDYLSQPFGFFLFKK